MKDSLGYIRRGSGKSALACAQIAAKRRELERAPADPATSPAGRTFGLCGAPDPAPPPYLQSLPEPPARRMPWRGKNKTKQER